MGRTKAKMQNYIRDKIAQLTPSSSSRDLSKTGPTFRKAPTTADLFPIVDPTKDGEDCLQDCSTCTVHLPRKFEIDEDDKLYGFVKGWNTHLVVATGKTDWVRDVADEANSVMEAVGKHGQSLKNGKLMLSASNMPTGGPEHHGIHGGKDGDVEKTRVLILPGWKIVECVAPAEVPKLLEEVVEKEATNTTILNSAGKEPSTNGHMEGEIDTLEPSREQSPDISALQVHERTSSTPSVPQSLRSNFSTHSCPHRAIILMCSQKTRDARCGQSAPLLRKEFERQLRPLGLYRDLYDERPDGVGIYFISHVGGHKYSANVMIYRREGRKAERSDDEKDAVPALSSEAVQGIWLARVRPEDCEGIVKYTVLQGKVVKPERQLRGGFDRERALVSW